MNVHEWLRATMRERAPWWQLRPEQLRMALWLVAVCEMRDGAPRYSDTIDGIAQLHRVSRSTCLRMLTALEQAGFCELWGQRGRGGITQIVLRDARTFDSGSTTVLQQDGTTYETVTPASPGYPSNGAGPGSLTHLEKQGCVDIKPDLWNICQVPETTDPSYLDLLRSSEDPDLISDLRSSTSRDPRRSTVGAPGGVNIWPTGESDTTPKEPAPKARSADICDRAFAAADYLRKSVLCEKPGAALGAAPWDPAVKAGRRLAWAVGFSKLHRTVLKALRNENPTTSEADAWTEIARTVHWVFHGQPIEPRFEVESPRTLAEKWDRVQTARMRAKAKPARGADGRPDPTAAREFRRITPESL